MIRIESDGTAQGTKVFDESGTPIQGVIAVSWSVTGEHPTRLARATLTCDAQILATAKVDGLQLLDDPGGG